MINKPIISKRGIFYYGIFKSGYFWNCGGSGEKENVIDKYLCNLVFFMKMNAELQKAASFLLGRNDQKSGRFRQGIGAKQHEYL